MRKPLSRRTLLRGAGGIAIALPFLDAMSAFAQTAPKKRLVLLSSPNGSIAKNWKPTGSETSFTLGPILAPLAAHKADLLILDGVNNQSSYNGGGDGAHERGMSHLWTGTESVLNGANYYGGGISIDQKIAAAVSVGTGGAPLTKLKSLELMTGAMQGAATLNRMIYAGPAQPLTPENNPFSLFSSLFSTVGGDTAAAQALAQKKSILDSVMADYQSLSAKLGPADKAKLTAHLDAIRDIESRLSLGTGTSSACTKPTMPATFDPNANANYPQAVDLTISLLAMALTCDLTRVASLQFSRAVSLVTFSWLGQSRNHHDMSHDALPEDLPASATAAQVAAAQDVSDKLTAINAWYAGKVANLITKLKGVSEGSGTLFDNCVLVWGNELSRGNTHARKPLPFVLAGKCAGAFRTGRFVTYSGQPHNNLLVSLMNAMGVPGSSFGNPAYCTGPLPGLT
ncbi:MAG: DUF1552 domain-containing protein [Myxococcaceae bacterium]|nr:DUF1552 domain-containing protein [Myxococcaceae bacterium]